MSSDFAEPIMNILQYLNQKIEQHKKLIDYNTWRRVLKTVTQRKVKYEPAEIGNFFSKFAFELQSELDDWSDPICFTGGDDTDQPDTTWPDAHCCRLYESSNFEDKYFDFCLKHYDQTKD